MDPLNWTVRLVDIPENGLSEAKVATDAECLAVAGALAVSGCDALACEYKLTALLSNRFRAVGTITVKITQPCVVTLDPMVQSYKIDLDVEFWPSNQIGTLSEEFDEPDREDPEPIENGELSLGRVVYELIAASVDPYPRSEGAELERDTSAAGAPATDHPFAALARLKPGTNDA